MVRNVSLLQSGVMPAYSTTFGIVDVMGPAWRRAVLEAGGYSRALGLKPENLVVSDFFVRRLFLLFAW